MTPMIYVILGAVAVLAVVCFLAILAAIPMAPVQRLMMYVTPIWLLNIMCRVCPKTAIGLLCHWINEKNPDFEERQIAKRRPNPLPTAKKMSKLSTLSLLNLLRQDISLWQYYMADGKGGEVKTLPPLPYILLEIIYDLGNDEGRKKVREVVQKSRMTIGSPKQADILENFKVDTVLDIFEDFEKTNNTMEIKMRLTFSNPQAVAMWLDHWDLRMQRLEQPLKSAYWLGQLPGKRAFDIEKLLKELEFRAKFGDIGRVYNRKDEWRSMGN